MKYPKLSELVFSVLLTTTPYVASLAVPVQPNFVLLPLSIGEEKSVYSIVEKDHKKGLANQDGRLIIPAQYEDLGWSKGSLTVIDEVIGYKQNGNWGLINIDNKKITEAKFHSLRPFDKELILASRRNKYSRQLEIGLVNLKGKEEIPFEYYALKPGNERLIAAVKERYSIRYGLISHKNKVLIPFEYEHIQLIGERFFAVFNAENKAALFDQDGERLTPFKFDHIADFQGDYAVVSLHGKKGLIDTEGKLLIEPLYKKIKIEDGKVQVLPFRKWEIIDANRKKSGELHYDQVTPLGEDMYKVRTDTNEMLVDQNDRMISRVQGWEIDRFVHGLARITEKGKLGLIDKTGKLVLEPAYDQIKVYENTLFVKRYNLYGQDWVITDHQGKKLSPLKYSDVETPLEGLIPVKRRDRWGLLSTTGEEIVPCKYDSLYGSYDGQIKVYYLSGFGMIDLEGRWTKRPFLKNLELFPNGYSLEQTLEGSKLKDQEGKVLYQTGNLLRKHGESSLIEKNTENKLGLVSLEGEKLLATVYDEISILQDSMIYTFRKDGDYGIIDAKGKTLMLTTGKFQEIHPMHEEFLGIKADDKYGFVDTQGRLRIANQYDSIGIFQEGMAPIKLLGNWGFVDKYENLKVQPLYETVTPFEKGFSIVKRDGKFGLVDKRGNLAQETIFDNLFRIEDGKYISEQNGHFGLITEDGRQIAPPKYDKIEALGNGFAIVNKRDQFGLLRINGVSVIAPIYEAVIHDAFSDNYLIAKKARWKTVRLQND